jgi:hypothetical protein
MPFESRLFGASIHPPRSPFADPDHFSPNFPDARLKSVRNRASIIIHRHADFSYDLASDPAARFFLWPPLL